MIGDAQQQRSACKPQHRGAAKTGLLAVALVLVLHGGLSAVAAPRLSDHAADKSAQMMVELAAPEAGRSEEDAFQNICRTLQMNPATAQFSPGSIIVDQETLLSAKQAKTSDDRRLEGPQFLLNLPEGSKMRAEITGERVLICPLAKGVQIRALRGMVRLIDSRDVIRATAQVAGNGTLNLDAFNGNEITLVTTAKSSQGSVVPVRVLLDTDTGRVEEDRHGVTRFTVFTSSGEPDVDAVKVKMQWVYDMFELQKKFRTQE